jgi:hypothetical protein
MSGFSEARRNIEGMSHCNWEEIPARLQAQELKVRFNHKSGCREDGGQRAREASWSPATNKHIGGPSFESRSRLCACSTLSDGVLHDDMLTSLPIGESMCIFYRKDCRQVIPYWFDRI